MPTNRSQLCKDTISSIQNLERQHVKSDTNSFRSRANCEILKAHLFLNHTSNDHFSTKFKMQYGKSMAAYLSPQTVRRSSEYSCYGWSIPRRPNVSWGRCHVYDFKTHFFPLKHSWAYFLFVREVSWSVFWSKMERRKWKPVLKMFSSGSTLRTPFCKHLLQLGPTPPSTYINIKQ